MLIFDGADIVVRQRLEPESDLLVFCFSARNSAKRNLMTPGEQIQGPGEAFFVKRQIPVILFTARWNHWWQTPEMDRLVDLLEAQGTFQRYRSIVTYGMSMGGYGALMYSKRLHASRVIAVAPQYTLDPKRVPGERRWREDRERYRPHYDDMDAGLISSGQVALLYDPLFKADRVHVRLIEQHRPVDSIVVPFSSHRVGRMLDDMGILSRLIEQSLRTGVDPIAFRSNVRAHRRAGPLYLSALSRAVFRRGHRTAALAHGERAIGMLEQMVQAHPRQLENVNRTTIMAEIVRAQAALLGEMGRAEAVVALLDTWIPRLAANHQKVCLELTDTRAKAFAQLGIVPSGVSPDQTKAAAPDRKRAVKVGAAPRHARALAQRINALGQTPALAAVDALEAEHRAAIMARERFALRFARILYGLGALDRAVDYLAHAPALPATPGDPRAAGARAKLTEQRILMLLRCGRPQLAAALADRLLQGEADARLRKRLFARIGQDLIMPVEDAFALPASQVMPPQSAPRTAPAAGLTLASTADHPERPSIDTAEANPSSRPLLAQAMP